MKKKMLLILAMLMVGFDFCYGLGVTYTEKAPISGAMSGIIDKGQKQEMLEQKEESQQETTNNVNQCDSTDFWGQASCWFGNATEGSHDIAEIEGVNSILNEFLNMINILGTAVIVCVTIILGIKFLFGGVEGQASAKQGLVTLLVACIFFFGWTSLKNILYPDNNFILTSSSDTSISNPVGRVFAYVKFFGNILAFIAIVWTGVKYIFSGSSGKADLKKHSVQFIIGLIMTFATVNFLSFISDAINQTLK